MKNKLVVLLGLLFVVSMGVGSAHAAGPLGPPPPPGIPPIPPIYPIPIPYPEQIPGPIPGPIEIEYTYHWDQWENGYAYCAYGTGVSDQIISDQTLCPRPYAQWVWNPVTRSYGCYLATPSEGWIVDSDPSPLPYETCR